MEIASNVQQLAEDGAVTLADLAFQARALLTQVIVVLVF